MEAKLFVTCLETLLADKLTALPHFPLEFRDRAFSVLFLQCVRYLADEEIVCGSDKSKTRKLKKDYSFGRT